MPHQGLRHRRQHGCDAAGDRRGTPPAPRTVALRPALPARIRFPPARVGLPERAQGVEHSGPDGGVVLPAPAPFVILPVKYKTATVPAAPERAAGYSLAAGTACAPACKPVPLPEPRSFC